MTAPRVILRILACRRLPESGHIIFWEGRLFDQHKSFARAIKRPLNRSCSYDGYAPNLLT